MPKAIHVAFASIVVAAMPALAANSKTAAPPPTKVQAMIHVNPGLWEVTITPKVSGEMPISDDELAKIPAERRAKIMAMMQHAIATPHKMKECMTQEKLNKGFSVGRDSEHCTSTVVSNTMSEMNIQETCSGDSDGVQSMSVHFIASGPASITGTTHVVASRRGRGMTIDSTVSGQWLGSSCGAVKDVEVEN